MDIDMTDEPVMDGLLRVQTAARFLGLSRSKVYLLMDSGELAYVKFGRCRRIDKRELIRLVERHTVSASKD